MHRELGPMVPLLSLAFLTDPGQGRTWRIADDGSGDAPGTGETSKDACA